MRILRPAYEGQTSEILQIELLGERAVLTVTRPGTKDTEELHSTYDHFFEVEK